MTHDNGRKLGFREADERRRKKTRLAGSRFETETYSMPIYWASYLINGDASGIDDDDIVQADAAIEDIGLGAPVDVSESEFRSRGDYGRLAGDYADYTFLRRTETNEARETHHVADFNTLDDLIAHARDELGATHVLFVDEEVHLYFPRQEGTYEKAEIWQKDGYWHAQGPGARTIVQKPPSNAQPIGGGRAKPMPKHDPKGSLPIIENGLRKLSGHPIDVRMGAAEARRRNPESLPVLPIIFRAERSGDAKGEVTAVFPTLPGTNEHDFTVYAHNGQHSVGSRAWYNGTRAATPNEYASLLAELRRIYEQDPDGPVKLHVVERFTRHHDAERKAEYQKWMHPETRATEVRNPRRSAHRKTQE